jgi:hypothetical protein
MMYELIWQVPNSAVGPSLSAQSLKNPSSPQLDPHVFLIIQYSSQFAC